MAFLLWLPFAVQTLEGDYDKIMQGSGLDMTAYEHPRLKILIKNTFIIY